MNCGEALSSHHGTRAIIRSTQDGRWPLAEPSCQLNTDRAERLSAVRSVAATKRMGTKARDPAMNRRVRRTMRLQNPARMSKAHAFDMLCKARLDDRERVLLSGQEVAGQHPCADSAVSAGRQDDAQTRCHRSPTDTLLVSQQYSSSLGMRRGEAQRVLAATRTPHRVETELV